jgi:hypothetical protein
MHHAARLSATDVETLSAWTKQESQRLAAANQVGS